MEVTDTIKIATELKDFKVWQYARIIDLMAKPRETDADRIVVMCEIMELASDKTAQLWREQYKIDFTVAQFEKVKAAFEQPLPSEPLTQFIFTTLTPESRMAREEEIGVAHFWKKRDLRNNLHIDSNRLYTVEKTANETFEQVIQTEILMKEIIRLDADVALKNYIKLPRLLAFICKLEGEQFHYWDKNDLQYKFNYPLISYREKVFMHLDVVTAWRVYLAFFLTVQEQSANIKSSGKDLKKE